MFAIGSRSADERSYLEALVSAGNSAVRKVKRARILLEADACSTDEAIAQNVAVNSHLTDCRLGTPGAMPNTLASTRCSPSTVAAPSSPGPIPPRPSCGLNRSDPLWRGTAP
jgi:hypothetical protein